MRLAATAAAILSFAFSALSFEVTIPNASQGWTNVGPQTLVWTTGGSDAVNFTVVLTNPDPSFFSNNNQVLAALVNATQSPILVNPPSGGWPLGSNFSVNFVQDPNNLSNVYAKSSSFDIKPPAANATSSTGTSRYTTAFTTPTNTAVSDPTPSDDGNNQNNAASTLDVQSGLSVMFAVLGLVLAY